MSGSPYTERPPVSPPATDAAPCDQLALWGATIEDAFNRYHADNPHVYAELLRMAYRAKAAGYERWSVKAMVEILRWERAILTGNPDGFRCNDHHSSFYARLLSREPGLEGMFQTRKLRSAVA